MREGSVRYAPHGSHLGPGAFNRRIGSRPLPLREQLRGLRGPLILHRMVKRELVVESPAEHGKGQQHCECQCWIPVSSFAVEGQQSSGPTISDSASTKNRRGMPMYNVGCVLRPLICLEAPDSSLFTERMSGKPCSTISIRDESDRMESFRGCTRRRMAAD